MPRVAFETLGCKVNQYESERIAARFADAGFEVVPTDEKADVCVINTCSVTQVAEAKSRKAIRRLARANPGAMVVVTGCDVEIAKRVGRTFPEATLLVPNEVKLDLLEYVLQAAPRLRESVADGEASASARHIPFRPTRTRAIIKVQDGCDMYCSFCSVPLSRGPVRSRTPDEILKEVRQEVDWGRREIVLTGILVGGYGKDLVSPRLELADLMEMVAAVPGVLRVRLSSIEPTQVSDRLLKLMASMPSICPHLHIPLQSGDDRVLEAMRRPYNAAFYRDLCQKAARQIPDLAITTDVLVGFPGEDEAAYQHTVALCREVGFARMHVFRYSPRPGTSASELPDQVPEGVKDCRMRSLTQVAAQLRKDFARKYIGRVLDVLGEPGGEQGVFSGYTPNYIRVRFRADGLQPGQLVPIRIEGVHGDAVEGSLASSVSA